MPLLDTISADGVLACAQAAEDARWRDAPASGMPDDLQQVVSNSDLARMIGNSMSMNVIARILARLLPAVGLVAPGEDLEGSVEVAAS